MVEYNFISHPENIYMLNLDETCLEPNQTPPNIISPDKTKVQSLVSPKSTTTTLIGYVKALESSLPSFFVFKGSAFMKSASVGARAIIGDSGWSNMHVFETYLKEHFLQYAKPSFDNPVLLLFDGHSSHAKCY